MARGWPSDDCLATKGYHSVPTLGAIPEPGPIKPPSEAPCLFCKFRPAEPSNISANEVHRYGAAAKAVAKKYQMEIIKREIGAAETASAPEARGGKAR